MKLSEVLKNSWPIKSDVDLSWLGGEKKEITEIQRQQSVWNTALTSCDREIDREALVKELQKSGGMLTYGEYADHIISTMPQWLRRIENEKM